MPFLSSEQKFSSITKTLHWLVFLLFATEFFLIYYRRLVLPKESAESVQFILLHKSIGATLLWLALLMLIWRHLGKRPIWPNRMPTHERILARIVHLGLYLVMLLMPISGYLMSSYAGYPVSVFGWFELPSFVTPDKVMAEKLFNAHGQIANIICVLVGLHLLGALKHHFIDKNNLLKRMLPFG